MKIIRFVLLTEQMKAIKTKMLEDRYFVNKEGKEVTEEGELVEDDFEPFLDDSGKACSGTRRRARRRDSMKKQLKKLQKQKKIHQKNVEDLKRQRKFHNFVYISLDSLTGVVMNTVGIDATPFFVNRTREIKMSKICINCSTTATSSY